MSKNKNPEEYIAETNQTSTGASTPMTADEIAAAEAKAAETAAAAADKAAADKAAEKKAKQDAAAAKAAKADSEANLRAIEDNTAKSVNADQEVRVFVTPKAGDNSRCEVCINGHWWKIKRGEWVPVPESVYLVLRESEKVLKENEELKGDTFATMML